MNIILDKAIAGERISLDEGVELFKNVDLHDLGYAANAIRERLHPGKQVSYIIDRNINYTNICTAGCRFCAFARWPHEDKGDSYTLPYETIQAKVQELVDQGGCQILLQGGHNPELKIEYYEDLFQRIKADFPQVTLHALSPSEVDHIMQASEISLEETIDRLQAAGWESFPGGGAEILVERVRNILSPLKISSERWLDIMEAAHNIGIHGSATMMFAHVESFRERIEHMERIRQLQDRTGGFRAFISWTFQKGNTPLSKDVHLAECEGAGDSIDYLRTQAISRIYLDNIASIQASWVTQGMAVGQIALSYGANDYGGTMLEENVVSSAGTQHSKSNQQELIYQISKAGYTPVRRDTFYNILD